MWEAMQRELELRSDEVQVPLESIYFWGGSPSLLPHDKITHLLRYVKSKFSIHDQLEVTIEVNPDDVSKDYLKELKELFKRLEQFCMKEKKDLEITKAY